MTSLLKNLLGQAAIYPLSYYFARFIAEQSDENIDSLTALSAALVSEANQQGHVCIDLEQMQQKLIFNCEGLSNSELITGISTAQWCQDLLQNHCVGLPGEITPLVLENSRLYLYRYWFYETQVAQAIRSRLQTQHQLDYELLSKQLDQLYPKSTDQRLSEQKLAVALSVIQKFAVISGGPGTGKTTTVINILAVLLSQSSNTRIALAAPTGKAAARMMDSIRSGLENSPIDDSIRELIPTEASTIHRLLGYRAKGFHYSHQHLLPVDCVVIDEASMVDLTLMYRLLDALPGHARIILLGDRDQLAAVAAGNVLGDITGKGRVIQYSTGLTEKLGKILSEPLTDIPTSNSSPAIADSIALLKQSYRFSQQSGIGQLASLVNQGDIAGVVSLLQSGCSEIEWFSNQVDRPEQSTLDHILAHYRAVVTSDNVETAFNAFECCRVLCAMHSGPFGDIEMNQRIEAAMRLKHWISGEPNFHARPVLILSNDYELELFNGDIGLLWRDKNGLLQAFFRDTRQGIRHFPINSLPEYESAWAMTVHKSQGSEFDSVVLVLPPSNSSDALSRELLYTGLTRAKNKLAIHATTSTLETACRTTRQRYSGLASKLLWE
ncbi:MAG: exodeoxyribonuclease V subunit alpha [Gammaproteobacteria bacterium]|nr:exodeoxyribonuclease V subunit alpha [Gammaproteobacteria bacterium]